jgi:serine protease Do
MKTKNIIIIAAILLIVGGIYRSGLFNTSLPTFRSFSIQNLIPKLQPNSQNNNNSGTVGGSVKVITEESVIIDAVDKVSPSVVTVGISKTSQSQNTMQFNPFDPFNPFQQNQTTPQKIEQDIGSGFIVNADGLIVTNKHVVSDTQATYRVITYDNKEYKVDRIYRDPTNDIAIIKINATGLTPIELGDSGKIKVGQLAIAIGTALGEFRHTVTTGVISGVGRGITAGSYLEGYVERLDNVIQTDAAINPGNSGGPLLNSGGQVIGINTAVSGEGQNIGFAIPINVVKDAINNFNTTGQFDRPFLGIRYKTISKDLALLNEVPEGAYVIEVVSGSPAEKANVQVEDIITKIDDTRLSGDNAELAKVIGTKKPGASVTLTIWRNGKESTQTVVLSTAN